MKCIYWVAQKSKPLPNDQKIVLNRIKPAIIVTLKYESSTIYIIRWY